MAGSSPFEKMLSSYLDAILLCSPFAKMLPSYLEGGLTADERARVQAHLSKCAACRRRLEKLRRIDETCAGLRAVEISGEECDNLTATVLHRARKTQARVRPSRALVHWASRPRWRRPLTATAAAAVLVVAFFIWQSFEGLGRVTWANVEQAIQETPWVHYLLQDPDTGEVMAERWYDTARGRHYFKSESDVPHLVLTDYESSEQWWYYPEEKTLAAVPLADGPEYEGNSFLNALTSVNSPGTRGEVAGDLIGFDVFLPPGQGASGKRELAARIWVDRAQRLPVRVVLYGPSSVGQGKEKVSECAIDYPRTGPADVFALGIPRTVKVIRVKDASPAAGESLPDRQANP